MLKGFGWRTCAVCHWHCDSSANVPFLPACDLYYRVMATAIIVLLITVRHIKIYYYYYIYIYIYVCIHQCDVPKSAVWPPVFSLEVHWPTHSFGPGAEKLKCNLIYCNFMFVACLWFLYRVAGGFHQSVMAPGIFASGKVQSPSEILEQTSAEKQKVTEQIRAENIRRFSEQGGFQLLGIQTEK